MTYIMQLDPAPFEKVKRGTKTIEMRLNDEKRRRMHAGDLITFLNRGDASDTLTVRVVALHAFASFEELYRTLSLEKCGYAADEVESASPHDMDVYYSPEEQARYGAVGIEIEALE